MENHNIYEGRAIAAPMVRVSCLSYRILCNKHNAGGCFTEELVALKLKKCIREVVTVPIPLTLLPVGFRLLAADVEKAIVGFVNPSEIYHDDTAEGMQSVDISKPFEGKLQKLSTVGDREDLSDGEEDSNHAKNVASSAITSLYLFPLEKDDDDGFSFASEADICAENKAKLKAIGDTTCGADDLIHAILTREEESDDDFTHENSVNAPLSALEVIDVLVAFRSYFGIVSNSPREPITISSEALVMFMDFFNTRTQSKVEGNQSVGSSTSTVRFLSPENVVAHIKVVEYVQYDPFKKGFRRATAASFLPKSIVNPFPEGDRRPEWERWGTVFRSPETNALSQSHLPRHTDSRCCQVICQLGAANPDDAAGASAVIASDVDGIDVNMGCPKAFSIQNGMGAALMKIPVTAGRILRAIHDSINNTTAMRSRYAQWHQTHHCIVPSSRVDCEQLQREGFAIPISFKTRIYGTTDESVKHLTTVLASCLRNHAGKREREGESVDRPASNDSSAEFPCPLHAISLHARTRPQRSETEPLTDQAREIMEKLRTVCAGLITSAAMQGTSQPSTEGKETQVPSGHDAKTSGNVCEAQTSPEAEEVTPIFLEQDGLVSTTLQGIYVPLSKYLAKMTFVFNGSVASNPLTSVPTPTFAGALLGRSCMWDTSVFNNHNHVKSHVFLAEGANTDSVVCFANRMRVSALSRPCPVPSVSAHIPFHELLSWAIPLNWGLASEWISMRKRITDLERYSLGQLGRTFLDVIRHFASYRKNTMYLKYYFTRTFSEFPVGKFTFSELEFLLLRDEDIVVPADCGNNDAEREAKLLEIATRISKLDRNARGKQIAFTSIQSPNTWQDFYVCLKRFELGNWGALRERKQSALDATFASSIEGGCGKVSPSDTKSILSQMSSSDRFIFAVMQRGDEVISEIPKSAFLRKENI